MTDHKTAYAKASHHPTVRVTTQAGIAMRCASLVQMDEDIAIAHRSQHGVGPDGVCSTGFASGFALILSSRHAVGLVHSQGGRGAQNDIEDAQEEFSVTTGEPGKLSVGFSPQGYRASLMATAEVMSAAEWANDQGQPVPPPGNDEALEKARIIEALVAARRAQAENLALHNGGEFFTMTHTLLAVSVDGTVHKFDDALAKPRFSPLE